MSLGEPIIVTLPGRADAMGLALLEEAKMYKMHFLSTTLKAKLEEIARQVLGMELALLVMVMALFLVVYIVR